MTRPEFTLRTGIYDAISPAKFYGRLVGKNALITGSSHGIGREIALALAMSGASVMITGRSSSDVNQTVVAIADTVNSTHGTNRVLGSAGDVCSEDDMNRLVQETVSKLGHVDILICNAGTNTFMPFNMTSASEWWHDLEVNLKAPTELVRKILPSMMEGNTGSIIFTSSRAAAADLPWAAGYSCAKTAITRFAGVLQKELDVLQSLEHRRNGISVFSIHPGEVKTQLHQTAFPERTKTEAPYVVDHMADMAKTRPDFKAELAAWTCVYLSAGDGDAFQGRLVDCTQDIAQVQNWLLSSQHPKITNACSPWE